MLILTQAEHSLDGDGAKIINTEMVGKFAVTTLMTGNMGIVAYPSVCGCEDYEVIGQYETLEAANNALSEIGSAADLHKAMFEMPK
jgi:hypothetical protein